jgi:DNA polymerase-3 subunit beta
MKIECIKEKLEQALQKSVRVTGKNLNLPVLSCILLEAKSGHLHIKATNLDLGIETSIPVKISEEGILAVPGITINAFVSSLQGEKSLKLESKEGNLLISGSKNKTIIKCLPHEDFPTIPTVSGERVCRVHSNDLIKGFKAVWYSSALSNMKPELSSIFVYSDEDGLVFVATDSFRLAEKKVKARGAKDFGQVLIPFRNATEIAKIFENQDEEIQIHISKNQISLKTDAIHLTSRVVDGAFPDYKQIIPKTATTEATVLKEDLISLLKIATIFGDKFNHLGVSIDPKAKRASFSTKNADIGENEASIDAALSGDPIDVSFNYKYITDSLQSIEADSITLTFNGAGKPMVMRGVSDKSFTYLVMPMNR